jgi:hypothetical protein
MGGKNDEKVATTTSEPWSGVREYLQKAYGDASKIYGKGAPQYYPGRQIAPMSGYTRGALDSMARRAQAGSPIVDEAQGMLGATLGGEYLNANPHLQGAINAATRPVIDQYTKTVIPGLESAFSSAGRYGSGAQGSAEADAYGQMMNQIGDIGSQMSYQNYGDERQRMMQGAGLSPMLAQQDYLDIDALGKAGMGFDQYNQSLIDADMRKWDFNQNREMDWLRNYLGLLQGQGGGTTTQYQPGPNPFTSTFGGALMGAKLGSIIPGLGTGFGALLGGGGGLLGSLF